MRALETTGMIDADHRHLRFDQSLSPEVEGRVRVIILYENDALSEKLWMKAAAQNPVFDDLHDQVEDIYTLSDGKPLQ